MSLLVRPRFTFCVATAHYRKKGWVISPLISAFEFSNASSWRTNRILYWWNDSHKQDFCTVGKSFCFLFSCIMNSQLYK